MTQVCVGNSNTTECGDLPAVPTCFQFLQCRMKTHPLSNGQSFALFDGKTFSLVVVSAVTRRNQCIGSVVSACQIENDENSVCRLIVMLYQIWQPTRQVYWQAHT